MRKKIRLITEALARVMLTFSGSITSLAILFIVIFLFKEGFGLFTSPEIDRGYSLCVNADNPVGSLSSTEIKNIFNEDVTNWKEFNGIDSEIYPFRFDDIFSLYAENEFGEDYELLPQKIGEVIAQNPNIIAFIPTEYIPRNNRFVKALPDENISFSDFFAGKDWIPTTTPAPQFGLLPLLLGTLLVSVFAIIIALPLGLGVAIYMSELAGERTRSMLKPLIELLAGIPSVVYGFFGLVVLVPLIQRGLHLPVGETALAGSIILAIMALPTIITIAEDAIRSTPRAMREASLALGATHWQTIYRVVVPYASSGIMAAIVLGIGRAIGETMAVLMVTGNAAVMPHSLFQSVRTIPATIAAELGEASSYGTHYKALFLLGCILFVISMFISVTAELIQNKNHNKEA